MCLRVGSSGLFGPEVGFEIRLELEVFGDRRLEGMMCGVASGGLLARTGV